MEDIEGRSPRISLFPRPRQPNGGRPPPYPPLATFAALPAIIRERIRARSYWLPRRESAARAPRVRVRAIHVWLADAQHLDAGLVKPSHEGLLQDEVTGEAIEPVDDDPGHLARLHDG